MRIFSSLCALCPFSPIARLRVQPDEPDAVIAPRPRGSRRPHTDAKVAAVRRLIEQTPLTYGEIAAKTGVGRASICRWTRDGGWQRPLFAPRATDTVPRARASAQLKRRTLAARLARARRAPDPRAGGQRLRRSRKARRGAGASEDGEARRPPASGGASRGRRRRGPQIFDASPRAVIRACAPAASGSSARRRRRWRISSPAARRCRRGFQARAGACEDVGEGPISSNSVKEGRAALLFIPSPSSGRDAQRQPRPGATCFRIASMTWAL